MSRELSGERRPRPATRVVHPGWGAEGGGASVVPPLGMSTIWEHGNPEGLYYGRDHDPSWRLLERTLADLEGTEEALLFGSGMAAISAAVMTRPPGALIVVAGDAYSGSRRLLGRLADEGRYRLEVVDATDPEELGRRAGGAALVLVESLGNPLLSVPDLARVAAVAHGCGGLLAVDNTFATPLLCRPADFGADLVLHSATKYIGGHSDLIMGVVAGSAELLASLRQHRTESGAVPGHLEVWLAIRGLKTLELRLRRQCESAQFLAERLSEVPRVTRVYYPGLTTHPQHQLARTQLSFGFGGVLSFELDCDAEGAEGVCRGTRIWTNATSLGAVESLMERRSRWPGEEHLSESLIRLAVGIEDREDLFEDLAQAISLLP